MSTEPMKSSWKAVNWNLLIKSRNNFKRSFFNSILRYSLSSNSNWIFESQIKVLIRGWETITFSNFILLYGSSNPKGFDYFVEINLTLLPLQGQNVEKLQKSCMKLNQAKFWESEYLKLFAENSSKITLSEVLIYLTCLFINDLIRSMFALSKINKLSHLAYQAIFKVLTFYFCY